ncbi:MAG: hypothetical protein NC182_03095 [Prevotella sp.]|nr:hypothetical protein [Staphylococcus sp.]MCM1350163.1 hypothetical protein [Prevotella sp.]
MTFSYFKKHKEVLKMLMAAHQEHIYLDYLNRNFQSDYRYRVDSRTKYAACFIVEALYNVSMECFKNDRIDFVKMVSDSFFNHLYLNKKCTF